MVHADGSPNHNQNFPWNSEDTTPPPTELSAQDALFRDPNDFFAAPLTFCAKFWEKHILKTIDPHLRNKYLRWIKHGVRIQDFLKPFTVDSYKGLKINSTTPKKQEFDNHIPPHQNLWVSQEINNLLNFGVIKKWSDCPGFNSSPTPHIVHPLQVKEQTDKNRLIYDAQYLNCFMDPPHFTMEGVAKVAQLGWNNMYMTLVDHKNGYFHIGLDSSSWKYFGLKWENIYYVYVTLTFGWSPSCFIYSTFTDLVANHVRTLTLALIVTWVDDSLSTNSISTHNQSQPQQLTSANFVCYILCMVLYNAGYFINLKKSILTPTQSIQFLGLIVDSLNQKFFVPKNKVDKLLLLINTILTENMCTLKTLEKCVGKCRNMSIAVPAAILYTRSQYQTLAENLSHKLSPHRARQKLIKIPTHLREELLLWLNLDTLLLNGGSWISPEHIYTQLPNLDAYTDASGHRWGGKFITNSETFVTAGQFSKEEIPLHINNKEAAALLKTLQNFLETHPLLVYGKLFIVKVDNEALFQIYMSEGSSKQLFITNICKQLFWLQIKYHCKINLAWIPSKNNLADPSTREDRLQDISITNTRFQALSRVKGPFHMDLMSSFHTAQRDNLGNRLPFYSQYYEKQAVNTDVFAQNISRTKTPQDTLKGPDYCFPPLKMTGQFLKHLMQCKGWCVVIVPETTSTWNHIILLGQIDRTHIANRFEENVFWTFRNNTLISFKSKFKMIAVELDFRV